MDLSEAGEGGQEFTGRTAAFGQGSSGNPYRVASSLGADSAKWNDEVGSGFNPQSVLNSTVQSGDGMNSNEYNSRILSNNTLLPSGNGSDPTTTTGIDKLLLDGKREVGTLGT
jgi:hypothetical protein